MKTIVSVIAGFMISVMYCSAQSGNQLNGLLATSIEKHIRSKEQLVKEGALVRDYLDKVVFLNDNFPGDFPFSKIAEEYSVAFFDDVKYGKSELRSGINVFRLLPVVLIDNTLSITIADGRLSKKRSSVTISSSGGTTYVYGYSCDTKRWELLETK
ncbi:hypothetical protein LZF95_21150 [Algoriphagus sp. AGSA1]|uniref:hypothetical protein n=1 Tax=Algoriphagus sp. AGSA1 TaxID=2907213 RepID=UPI001F1EC33B|nr:hypothetical protein [Algoriphagus sp. AGSA1]MCE7057202.1 hypothetical protein [Algoriphagus sp. AGSA1]